jgi:CRP-like cAMP-binding protein
VLHAPKDAMASNHLLSRLARADLRLLAPHLTAVDLPLRRQLEARNRKVAHIYFLETGLASVVANGGEDIEVGVIGREGMTGLSVVLDGDRNNRAVHETFMQMAGKGLRMPADDLRAAITKSVALHRVLLRYAHAFLIQTTQTALANGRSNIEERLARWLLMAADRTDGDELPLTHEFLATMLGVRRSGVTVALQGLERTGLIAHKRGVIAILDREAMEKSSNGTYVRPNDK